jgi:hypothetical protein
MEATFDPNPDIAEQIKRLGGVPLHLAGRRDQQSEAKPKPLDQPRFLREVPFDGKIYNSQCKPKRDSKEKSYVVIDRTGLTITRATGMDEEGVIDSEDIILKCGETVPPGVLSEKRAGSLIAAGKIKVSEVKRLVCLLGMMFFDFRQVNTFGFHFDWPMDFPHQIEYVNGDLLDGKRLIKSHSWLELPAGVDHFESIPHHKPREYGEPENGPREKPVRVRLTQDIGEFAADSIKWLYPSDAYKLHSEGRCVFVDKGK